ncbi:MAG: hypothetical protein KDK54_19255, partial [Leptospiraceae bacterium]|nr:hypothetical protein [Leptospiraceae bacterium]
KKKMKDKMNHASQLKSKKNRGIEIGKEIGKEQGIEIGKEQGKLEGLKKGLLALHSIGKSPDEISILLDISLEEVHKILNSDETEEEEEL